MLATLDLLLAEPLEIEGLTPEERREVAQRRCEALAETGRLELDTSAMHLLARGFIAELGEFPLEAVDTFYALRDELPASVPDTKAVDTLVTAVVRLGGGIEAVDIPELARELHYEDDTMSRYSITDAAGHTYCWDPQRWTCGEFAPGWDGERWEADYDD